MNDTTAGIITTAIFNMTSITSDGLQNKNNYPFIGFILSIINYFLFLT